MSVNQGIRANQPTGFAWKVKPCTPWLGRLLLRVILGACKSIALKMLKDLPKSRGISHKSLQEVFILDHSFKSARTKRHSPVNSLPAELPTKSRVKQKGKQWWLDPGSNWGHADFQSAALPTELSSHRLPCSKGRIQRSAPLFDKTKSIYGFL